MPELERRNHVTHRPHTLLALGMVLILCALLPRLTSSEPPTATPSRKKTRAEKRVKIPFLKVPNVPLPAEALSIYRVQVGTPRSKVEQWYGPGQALGKNQLVYGEAYNDGLQTRHPLEVIYSAQGLATEVSGTVLYRGDQKVQLQWSKKGEIVLPGVCRGVPAEAMMVDPKDETEFHSSQILGPPFVQPKDARVGVHLVDGNPWFGIW